MSDTQVETTEPQESAPQVTVQETSSEAPQTPESNDNETSYAPRVDLGALPDEIRKPVEDRLSHLSRLMRKQEKLSQNQLGEYRELVEIQAKRIEELSQVTGKVVDHLMADNEQTLQAEMLSAFETGDYKKATEAQQRLIQIGVSKELNKVKPQPQQQRQVNNTQTAHDLDPEQTTTIKAWESESDEQGNPVRPWAKTADPSDPDPDFIKALAVTNKVFKQFPYRTTAENLAEVDKRMGTKQKANGQTVMGGSLTTFPKKQTIRLQPEIERMAVRTKFAGPGKTDAEHISAYRKEVESQRTKRS